MDAWMCAAETVGSTPDISIALLINYIPIQNKRVKKSQMSIVRQRLWVRMSCSPRQKSAERVCNHPSCTRLVIHSRYLGCSPDSQSHLDLHMGSPKSINQLSLNNTTKYLIVFYLSSRLCSKDYVLLSQMPRVPK